MLPTPVDMRLCLEILINKRIVLIWSLLVPKVMQKSLNSSAVSFSEQYQNYQKVVFIYIHFQLPRTAQQVTLSLGRSLGPLPLTLTFIENRTLTTPDLFTHCMVSCGQCPILHTMWWMTDVVNVVQSLNQLTSMRLLRHQRRNARRIWIALIGKCHIIFTALWNVRMLWTTGNKYRQ